jgi:hypothetical protein
LPSGQNEAWRKLHPPSEAFWEPDAWDRFLANARTVAPNTSDLMPNFDAQVLVQPLHDPLHRETFSVRIALENLRESDATKECGLFNVDLIVELPNDALGPMRLERVRRSYHLAGFMTMPAIGVNGGVCDLGMREGVRALRTTWMPRHVPPRAQATEIPTVPTSYRQLGVDTADANELAALPRAMRDWIDVVARETELSVPGEEGNLDDEAAQQNRFQGDVRAWRSEAARIAAGVDVLAAAQQAWRHDRTSAVGVPYRAWLLLNRTFAAGAPTRDDEPPAGWRLFQLAFVVAHIPTFASRLPEYAGSFDAHTRKAHATREAPERGQVRNDRINRTPARERPGTSYTEGFSHFVTSMTAPVASGWSVRRGGTCTHWKAPPSHGARKQRSFRGRAISREECCVYSLRAMFARIRSISACSSAVSVASVSWMASFFKSPVNLKGT